MAPPEMLDESAAPVPEGLEGPEPASDDAGLRTELAHRHLLARLDVAREQIQILEDHSPAPEVLVARLGATITEAQRAIDAERALVVERAEARRRSSEARAAEVLAQARAEAMAMREVAQRLRSTVAVAEGPASGASVPGAALAVSVP